MASLLLVHRRAYLRRNHQADAQVLADQRDRPHDGVVGQPRPRRRIVPAEAFDGRTDLRKMRDQWQPDDEAVRVRVVP